MPRTTPEDPAEPDAVSLAGLDPVEAPRALLAIRPDDDQGDDADGRDEQAEHRLEIVQRHDRAKNDDMAYWRCSCGVSAGGRWYGSAEEAHKAADRHVERA